MSTPQAAPAPQAPQAPQITTTSPNGQTTSVQNSPPVNANVLAHPAAATTAPTSDVPTTTPSILQTPTPGAVAVSEELTYNEQLNAVDRLWKFKMALTVVLIFTGIIGIGCIAWAVSTSNQLLSDYSYGWDSSWSLPWGLITFSVSVVWCALCIILFISRKRPVHPGVRVTMDLLLWLSFIVTALFTMVALFDVIYWGEDGRLSYSEGFSTRYGSYNLQRNNTWVWIQDSDYSGVTYDRVCNGSSSNYYYSYAPTFANCAEMDAYVNQLWHDKPNRARTILTGVVCQWLGLLLHFVLFVWACVDCHKHRKSRVSRDAEKLAAGIVQNMVQNGAIVPPPGQAHMRGSAWQPYAQLPSTSNSVSAQGGWVPQQQQPVYAQPGAPQMQMRGPHRPVSGEQPLPPLPSRAAQGSAGPSREKAVGVADSYYEPQR